MIYLFLVATLLMGNTVFAEAQLLKDIPKEIVLVWNVRPIDDSMAPSMPTVTEVDKIRAEMETLLTNSGFKIVERDSKVPMLRIDTLFYFFKKDQVVVTAVEYNEKCQMKRDTSKEVYCATYRSFGDGPFGATEIVKKSWSKSIVRSVNNFLQQHQSDNFKATK